MKNRKFSNINETSRRLISESIIADFDNDIIKFQTILRLIKEGLTPAEAENIYKRVLSERDSITHILSSINETKNSLNESYVNSDGQYNSELIKGKGKYLSFTSRFRKAITYKESNSKHTKEENVVFEIIGHILLFIKDIFSH